MSPADGVVEENTFAALRALQDSDGTRNFNFADFADKQSGRFADGRAPEPEVRENVRRLMYRLEAVRKKNGDRSVTITSGYRTSVRNARIGGASNSQHTYGTAADNRISGVENRPARDRARTSAISAIFCYDSTSHNHFDIRANNKRDGIDDNQTQDPPRFEGDSRDRDSDSKQLCRGEPGAAQTPLISDGGDDTVGYTDVDVDSEPVELDLKEVSAQ